MKLRRPYVDRVMGTGLGLLLFAGGAALAYETLLWATWWLGWLFGAVAAVFGLVVGGWLMLQSVRPFRIDIDARGWSIRTSLLSRRLRWDEIASVVLADASGRRVPTSRLLLVPSDRVDLGVPLTETSPVDGLAAVQLFELGDIDYSETQFVRDLSALARGLFHNLSAHMARPAGAISLHRFPAGPDRARLRRWLDRRKAALFVGWYLLVLVPPLLLTDLATRYSEFLGVAALAASALGIWAATGKIWSGFGGRGLLADETAMIDGPDLVTSIADVSHRVSLHSGRVRVLRPGTARGYGKAWLLGYPGHKERPVPKLLLGDPRTGRLRSTSDLRALAAALRGSEDERDHEAAQTLDRLAAQASRDEPMSASTPAPDDLAAADDAPRGVWRALKGLGRSVPLLGVVAAVALAGGGAGADSVVVGPALVLAGAALFGLWVLYTLYRTLMLLDALLTRLARLLR